MFVILLRASVAVKSDIVRLCMELLFTDACFTPSRGCGGRKKPRVICEWSFCCFYEFRFRLASARVRVWIRVCSSSFTSGPH
jgi:hypothetical protein